MDNYHPTVTSGYETDIISEFAQNNFSDVLETGFSDTVTLCNYDLSERRDVRCIIQGNTPDTTLNSMRRIGLFPIGTVKTGMYVFFDGAYWLITGRPGNNKAYEKVVLDICQYKLKWQNANGDIIERYGNFTSASKYDVGEKDKDTITLTSDNLTILLPQDDETLYLGEKRVFIDTKPIPEKVYKITRTDDVLYTFGESGGVIAFIADKTELRPDVDNQTLGICDYKVPSNTSEDIDNIDDTESNITYSISGNQNLKFGVYRTYKAKIMGENDTELEWGNNYSWNIDSDFAVKSITNGKEIKIMVEKDDFIGLSFTLQITDVAENQVVCEKTIVVADVL